AAAERSERRSDGRTDPGGNGPMRRRFAGPGWLPRPHGRRRVARCRRPRVRSDLPATPAASVYDRYSYDAEKEAAMEFWMRQLTAIQKGRSAATAGRFRM